MQHLSRTRKAATVAFAGTALLSSLLGGTGSAPAITVEPEQTWESGVVAEVSDGDTVLVNILQATAPDAIAPADPTLRTYCDNRADPGTGQMPAGGLVRCRVRTIGVQAPEKHGTAGSALGQCGADQATTALKALLPTGTPVQLRSIRVNSYEQQYSGGRIARSVFYQQSPGVWVDSAEALYRAGLVLWMPLNVNDSEKPEYTHNLDYRRLFEEAASAGRGLWSANLCGPGSTDRLRMYIVSDPAGDDAGREQVVIFNDTDAPVDLSNWTVRDSSFTYARLAPGTAIGAHDYLRVYSGRGVAGVPTAHDLYFNSSGSMFANFRQQEGYFYGDSAYLFDAQPGFEYGNLRGWAAYPCLDASCTDPLRGSLAFTNVQFDPPGTDTADGEYVEIGNSGQSPVHLAGYQFRRQNTTYQFAPELVLGPGATIRLVMGSGVDSVDQLHLGRSSSLLTNSGDLLFLENVNSAAVDCRAWGQFTCPPGVPTSTFGPSPAPSPVPSAQSASAAAVPATPGQSSALPGAVAKPLSPQSVSAQAKSRRLTIRWIAPVANGAITTKYRARAYVKSGSKYKWRATCYASAAKATCRTKRLAKGKTYYVTVAARSKAGYGPTTARVAVRNK